MEQFKLKSAKRSITTAVMGPKGSAQKLNEERLLSTIGDIDIRKSINMLIAFSVIQIVLALAVAFMTSGGTVWTTDELPKSGIAWYVDVADWKCAKWGAEFILFYMRIPMYAIPGIFGLLYATNPFSRTMFVFSFMLSIIIAVVWGLGMLIWDAIRWGQCSTYAICVSEVTGTTAKLAFYFTFFGHIANTIATLVIMLVTKIVFDRVLNKALKVV